MAIWLVHKILDGTKIVLIKDSSDGSFRDTQFNGGFGNLAMTDNVKNALKVGTSSAAAGALHSTRTKQSVPSSPITTPVEVTP